MDNSDEKYVFALYFVTKMTLLYISLFDIKVSISTAHKTRQKRNTQVKTVINIKIGSATLIKSPYTSQCIPKQHPSHVTYAEKRKHDSEIYNNRIVSW